MQYPEVSYYVVDYTFAYAAMYDKITDPKLKHFARECRGLIYDIDERLVGVGFHKFFNYGEHRETFERGYGTTSATGRWCTQCSSPRRTAPSG